MARIAGPDLLLFGVGALLFTGAAYALVQSDEDLGGQGSALGIYTVSYDLATTELPAVAVPDMSRGTAEFAVNATDVTRVTVTVTCAQDAAGAAVPFNLNVEVVGPDGLAAQPTQGRCGTPIEVVVAVGEKPADTTVQGNTPEEARANVPAGANATRASGTWTVTVAGARGTPAPLPTTGPTNPAGSVALALERAEPRLTPVPR